MDIALVLDRLIPGGDWQGSVTDNTKEAFDNVRWNDERPKPSWEEMEAKWPEIEAEPEPKSEIEILKERIKVLEDHRIKQLEA